MHINEYFKKTCPVEIGDTFYRDKPNLTIPDRLKVVDIQEKDGYFLITARYMYHAMGPNIERTFSDIIFKDPSWIIEKRGGGKAVE